MEYEILDECEVALFEESSNPNLREGPDTAWLLFADESADLDESLHKGVLIPEEEEGQLG